MHEYSLPVAMESKPGPGNRRMTDVDWNPLVTGTPERAEFGKASRQGDTLDRSNGSFQYKMPLRYGPLNFAQLDRSLHSCFSATLHFTKYRLP
jgi:hypothetical protein